MRKKRDSAPSVRRRAVGIAVAVVAPLAMFGATSSAFATTQLQEEFAQFSDCPLELAEICTVATTTSGEFVMGSKTVTINKPIVLQGGLLEASNNLIPAVDGNTLSKTPLTLPGGLVGIPPLEIIGGEVTATSELAGPVSVDRLALITHTGTAVTLPMKVKLTNELLGNECYIGSDAEPIILHLTTGTTSPPAPNTPISGKFGVAHAGGKGKAIITLVEGNSLVDNSFAAPGVTGCGEGNSAILDPLVDAAAGLPSAAGKNTAILNGKLAETLVEQAKKHIKFPKPKKEKKEKVKKEKK
jgi:hypothetical protein